MIRRKLFGDLQAHLLKKEFSIITGARQTGKSTLLKQLEFYCKEMGIPVVFLNLENKTILAELNENPLNLLNSCRNRTQEQWHWSMRFNTWMILPIS